MLVWGGCSICKIFANIPILANIWQILNFCKYFRYQNLVAKYFSVKVAVHEVIETQLTKLQKL